MVGLVLLIGLTKHGDEYVGGQILDPDDGKVYRSKLRLIQNGQQLNVRGYISVPCWAVHKSGYARTKEAS